MRTRKKKWTGAELADNPRVLRGPSDVAALGTAHVELGCGKGRFIVQMAALHPETPFIAVERDPTILAAAARLSRETAAANAPRFLLADAAGLPEYFKPGGVARLYINFCDPWHRKKKWAKRRLTHAGFLAVYESLLIPEIFFKTDNPLLFEFSIESFSARGWRLRNVSLNAPAGPGGVMTEYEEKFRGMGMPVYSLEAHRDYPPRIL